MALLVNGSTHLIPAYYSFYRPRKDERLSWPSGLTCSGWLTHISGHSSAAGRAQDRESSPARDRRSTTVPCHQLERPKVLALTSTTPVTQPTVDVIAEWISHVRHVRNIIPVEVLILMYLIILFLSKVGRTTWHVGGDHQDSSGLRIGKCH